MHGLSKVYLDRIYLSGDPWVGGYRGWAIRQWVVIMGVHVLIGMVREDQAS